MSGRQFDWGGRLQKSNGGVQRLVQRGRKSRSEYKRINRPNCETDTSNSNGSAVRRLKWYASWVQNVVRQFGPYLSWAQDI